MSTKRVQKFKSQQVLYWILGIAFGSVKYVFICDSVLSNHERMGMELLCYRERAAKWSPETDVKTTNKYVCFRWIQVTC